MKKMTLTLAAILCAGSAYAASVQVSEPGLVSYTIVDDMAINEPLTDTAGDAANGRKLAVNRKKGNCLACHVMPISEQSFHGETAPSLYGVGNRLSEGELRLQLGGAGRGCPRGARCAGGLDQAVPRGPLQGLRPHRPGGQRGLQQGPGPAPRQRGGGLPDGAWHQPQPPRGRGQLRRDPPAHLHRD